MLLKLKNKWKNLLAVIRYSKGIFKNWYIFVLEHYMTKYLRYRFKKFRYIYRLRTSEKFIVRLFTWDSWIIDEIFARKVYNPKGFEIEDNYLILDIGAHIGVFSIYASKLSKNGCVYAFEPNKENFMLFKKNIELNKCYNIIPICSAIRSKGGKEDMYLSKSNEGKHTFLLNLLNQNNYKVEKVNVMNIENFIEKNKLKKIDFLKIDVEGSEYDILFSMKNNNFKKIKKIVLEYHNINAQLNINTLSRFLKKKGYKINISSKNDIIYAKR